MRLHVTVIQKLLYLVQNYGGHENDSKLQQKFEEIDLTPYERQNTSSQEVILVLTEEYMKQLSNTGR